MSIPSLFSTLHNRAQIHFVQSLGVKQLRRLTRHRQLLGKVQQHLTQLMQAGLRQTGAGPGNAEYAYHMLIQRAAHHGGNGWCLALVEPDGERTFISFDGIENQWQAQWLEPLTPTSGFEIGRASCRERV